MRGRSVRRTHHFAQQCRLRLVRGQREHNQIRVEAVQAMRDICIVVRPLTFAPDKVHDLVLTLARHFLAAEDHAHVAPNTVGLDLQHTESDSLVSATPPRAERPTRRRRHTLYAMKCWI